MRNFNCQNLLILEENLDEIRLEMHGPFSSDRSFEIRSEELDQTPNSIYSCGILFPQETLIEDLTSQETLDDSDTTSDTENTQENSDTSNTRQRDNSSEDDNYFDDLNLSSQLKPRVFLFHSELKIQNHYHSE